MLVFAAMVAGLTLAELSAVASSRRDVVQRFEVRASSAAGFMQSYIGYTLGGERALAAHLLSGPTVSQAEFDQFRQIFGFGPALLLDGAGRDMAVAPYDPTLIGADLAGRYPHLARALSGQPTVSNVVASAARRVPIVAFATSFPTPSGTRVVSGGFDLSSQPLGQYLDRALPYRDGNVWLIDGTGQVITSSSGRTGPLSTLAGRLARVVDRSPGPVGTFAGPGGTRSEYAVAAVPDTPWRLVFTLPQATLFEPLARAGHTIPWVLLGGFALTAAGLLVMLVRALEAKARSDDVARTDPLTGLANRRAGSEALDRMLAERRRYGTPMALLLIDVDHFKAVNDRFGHSAGDGVLRGVAEGITAALRAGDVVARWGGEEFLALLCHADGTEAEAVSERVRAVVAGTPVPLGGSAQQVTVSIGAVAAGTGDGPDALIARADAALYEAKRQGRNRVVVVADGTLGNAAVPAR